MQKVLPISNEREDFVMKKTTSKKVAILCIVAAVLVLAAIVFLIARPISYDWGYYAKVDYQGQPFEGAMKFSKDGTMVARNSNNGLEMDAYYYYKDGYVFFTVAQTEEEYEEEIAYINENFEEACNTPFYADKINAFQMVMSGPDGYDIAYTCTQTIVFVIIAGVIELSLIGLACLNLIACKKAKQEE